LVTGVYRGNLEHTNHGKERKTHGVPYRISGEAAVQNIGNEFVALASQRKDGFSKANRHQPDQALQRSRSHRLGAQTRNGGCMTAVTKQQGSKFGDLTPAASIWFRSREPSNIDERIVNE
jgi:hypothetical protein